MTVRCETAGLGPSWLSSTPDGAEITRRDVHECTVTAVFDGYMSYRAKGQRRRDYLDHAMVAGQDAALLRAGARFWLVIERVRLRGGRLETRSAVRFRRPGVTTAEKAFVAKRPHDQEDQR